MGLAMKGNGVDNVLVDFSAQDLWALMNNNTWRKRHGFNPDGMPPVTSIDYKGAPYDFYRCP